jgi:uncharacterized protein (TIGR02246 family)
MTDNTADAEAIKEVISQYAARANAGDLDGWLSLWAEDAVRMPDNAPARIGKEEIRAEMMPAFDAMEISVTINDIQDIQVWGNRGLTRGTYSLALTPKAGGETIHAMPDGKALTLYEKQPDGTWKIVYDCMNSNLPPK